MRRNLITKIFVTIFTMGIVFSGLNSVLAAGSVDCSGLTQSSPDSCNLAPKNCRTNPTTPSGCRSQGCLRVSSSQWFNNNGYIEEGVSVSGMNEAELSAYEAFTTYFKIQGLLSPENARKIQETINIVNQKISTCGPVCEDGRFGNNTIENLKNCLPCGGNSENGAQIIDGKLDCKEGYSMDDQLCCNQIQTECLAPYLLINGSPDTATYSDVDLEVTVDYSSNEGNIDFDTSKIIVVGGDINSDFNTGNKIISFSIGTIDGTDSIAINVDDGCAILTGNLACPPIGVELNRCNTPTTSCEAAHGDGWTLGDDGCCFPPCGSNESADGVGGCECDEAALKCADKNEKKDPNACKCVCDPKKQCCGIQLNTVVPFIGDCIEMTTQNSTNDGVNANTSNVNQLNAFPFLMMGLSKILVTVILIFSFLIVIFAGLMIVAGVQDVDYYNRGKKMIMKILGALILLGSSGLILKLINPSFFGG